MTAFERESFTLRISVTFRTAEKSDVSKLEWNGEYIHLRNLIRRAYQEQVNGRRLMLVADFNDFPIGQVYIQKDSLNSTVADGKTRGYLYSFRVMSVFRGLGIGTRLLEEAESILIRDGFEWATLSVAKDNEAAFRLYQRAGYKIYGEDPGRWSYLDHRGKMRSVEEPCWMLEKKLVVY